MTESPPRFEPEVGESFFFLRYTLTAGSKLLKSSSSYIVLSSISTLGFLGRVVARGFWFNGVVLRKSRVVPVVSGDLMKLLRLELPIFEALILPGVT